LIRFTPAYAKSQKLPPNCASWVKPRNLLAASGVRFIGGLSPDRLSSLARDKIVTDLTFDRRD
jgi:hypothetical protein